MGLSLLRFSAGQMNSCHPSSYIAAKYSDLGMLAQRLSADYGAREPFPHVVIDDLFTEEILGEVADSSQALLEKVRLRSSAITQK